MYKTLVIGLGFCIFLLLGWQIKDGVLLSADMDETSYYVVALDNNQAFFGKIQTINQLFLDMTDVYYLKTQVNSETKEVSKKLIKRSTELHQPQSLRIMMGRVVYLELVGQSSKLAKLLKDHQAK